MARAANVTPDSLSGPVVLFVSYAGVYGGAERLLVDWATGLEHECAIACPPGPLADAAVAGGVRVFELRARDLRLRGRFPLAPLADLAGHAREIRRLVGALAPELVVAWGMRPLLAALALGGAGNRPVAFQHNDFLAPAPIGAVVRRAALRAELITAPSRAVMDELRLPARARQRAHVVSPGVDLAHFDTGPRPDSQVSPEILVVGAIVAWKAPDLALEVLAHVRRRHPGARLRIVGGPLTDDVASARFAADLHARAERPDLAGAVTFAGALQDPADALRQAALLLHCARREPFGIAVVEALASGRPAVVPDRGGPAEIVDETCGRRYPPGDAHAAAEAVSEILADRDLARRLGAAGRRRAHAHYERARQRAAYRAVLATRLSGPSAWRNRLAHELALVTVTHNSARHLRGLLTSVDRHLPGVRIVVADCASSDDSVAIARAHPGTHVLTLPNVGFGAACNRAVAQVAEPVTALVNPDVEFIDASLLELVIEARASPARLFAPRVLNPDGTLQDTVHPAPLSPADLARALVPPSALPGPVGLALAPWRAARPRPVGWAVGCALVARTDALRELGPFDERIFLYGEDMELGLRARAAGIATWLWPTARVVHHGGHSIEAAHDGEAFALRAQARHDALTLARGARSARLDDAAQAVTFASRLVLKRALGRGAERERRQLAAVLAVARVSVRPHPAQR